MKRLLLTLTNATFILPLCASAHGEEILFPVFLQFGSIAIFLILLLLSKHEAARKLELAAIYFLSLGFIVLFTSNVSYDENRIAPIF